MTQRTMFVKLFGGPMSGRVVEVAASADEIVVGPWTYTFAGRDGAAVQFALRPRSRAARRLIRQAVERTGQHPLVAREYAKGKPVRGRISKRGQGARRREAARKLRVDQAAWRASDGYSGR